MATASKGSTLRIRASQRLAVIDPRTPEPKPAIVCGKPARKTLVAENDRDNGDVIFLPETTSGVGNFGGG